MWAAFRILSVVRGLVLPLGLASAAAAVMWIGTAVKHAGAMSREIELRDHWAAAAEEESRETLARTERARARAAQAAEEAEVRHAATLARTAREIETLKRRAAPEAAPPTEETRECRLDDSLPSAWW